MIGLHDDGEMTDSVSIHEKKECISTDRADRNCTQEFCQDTFPNLEIKLWVLEKVLHIVDIKELGDSVQLTTQLLIIAPLKSDGEKCHGISLADG
jgi:hypothetical protein